MNDSTIPNPHQSCVEGKHAYSGQVARSYDADRCSEQHWHREIEFVEQFCKQRSDKIVLDVPVGTGRLLHAFDKADVIYGIDVSADMVAQAKLAAGKLGIVDRCVLTSDDAANMPFQSDFFDLVVVVRLLHLLPPTDLSTVIGELARVARGCILVQSYVPPIVMNDAPQKSRSPLAMARWFVDGVLCRLRRFFPTRESKSERTQGSESSKPWSHIMAHYHDPALIEGLFRERGYTPTTVTEIDQYMDTQVRMTVYEAS